MSEAASHVRLRVHVDRDKCQGHNRCYSLAPELFDVDDLGEGFERGDGMVPPGLEDQARRAVANCPEYAITLTEVLAPPHGAQP
jgi:ferredoxin